MFDDALVLHRVARLDRARRGVRAAADAAGRTAHGPGAVADGGAGAGPALQAAAGAARHAPRQRRPALLPGLRPRVVGLLPPRPEIRRGARRGAEVAPG